MDYITAQRVAIQGVLSQYFAPDALNRVMIDWQNNYSDKPAFTLQQLLAENCERERCQVPSNTILQQVLDELLQVHNLHNNAGSVTLIKSEVGNDVVHTFYDFLMTLYEKPPQESQTDVMLSFFELSDDLSTEDKKAIQLFLVAKSSQITRFSEDYMRQLISNYYQSLCLWFGPVDADDMFYEAIQDLKRAGKKDVDVLL